MHFSRLSYWFTNFKFGEITEDGRLWSACWDQIYIFLYSFYQGFHRNFITFIRVRYLLVQIIYIYEEAQRLSRLEPCYSLIMLYGGLNCVTSLNWEMSYSVGKFENSRSHNYWKSKINSFLVLIVLNLCVDYMFWALFPFHFFVN